jgi:type I restriction-modification system DNA methylase subunit
MNKNLFSNYILNVKIKNEYKDLSADEVRDFKKICQRWNEAKGLENEIQHQHNFLQDFFCKILGYTGETGNEENTLWWESGTNDGRRPDGILGFNLKGYKDKDITKGDNINDGDIRVVIELKGADVNLDRNQNRKGLTITPVEQGFLYAPKVGGKCEWVIVSNFKEIRLYKSTEANKYHSFTISELATNHNKIKEFHFLLAKGRLFTKDKNKSFVHFLNSDDSGQSIENIFYDYYYDLRLEAWEAIYQTNNNTHTYGKNFYLYKAQKLIDRIIFIRFCKEKGALDGDAVLEALNNKFIKGKYNRLKALFTAMNEGNTELGISKFNGGLFAEDKDLDSLIVDDEIIDRLVDFYSHDFGSELDVNILGHIFEQSISDLETLTGDNQAKRKKDGVFYTPSFIVDYVMHLSIGSWLNNVRARLNLPLIPQPRLEETISDEEWQRLEELGLLPSKQEVLANRRLEEQELEALKNKVKEEDIEIIIYPSFKNNDNDNVKSGSPRLPAVAGMGGESGEPCTKGQNQRQNKWQKWQAYADKLKSIKVLDPSCGSGAFLVKVFDYLQNEWKEVEKHIKTDYTYKDILKNNIYGVDLNPVSAGITKLSLWLKTAHYKEPLTSLDKNIKTGNTLIEDTDLAGYYEEYEGRIITQTLKSNQELFGDDGLNIKSDAEMQELIAKGLQKPLAFNWQKEFESVFKPQNYPQGQGQSQSQDNTHPSLLIKGYERAKKPSANNANIDITNKAFALNNDSLDQSFTEGEGLGKGEREGTGRWEGEEDNMGRGFDVIVGNPPYVSSKNSHMSKEQKNYFFQNYKTTEYQIDTYTLFIEKCLTKLLKTDGIMSFIIPDTILTNLLTPKIRELILTKSSINNITICGGSVFDGASVETMVFQLSKNFKQNNYIKINKINRQIFLHYNIVSQDAMLNNKGFIFSLHGNEQINSILSKMQQTSIPLGELYIMTTGIKEYQVGKGFPKQTADIVENKPFNSNYQIDETYKPQIIGSDIDRYLIKWQDRFISYGKWLAEPRDASFFEGNKIILRQIIAPLNIIATFTNDYFIAGASTFVIKQKNENITLKYILPLLTSRLLLWFFRYKNNEFGKLFPQIKMHHLQSLPIPIIPQDAQKPFEEKAEAMLKLNKDLKTHSTQMVEFLVDKFLPYHKPKSKKQALEDFNALKTDTDYDKSIPEINRVANHNNSLAKRLSKDTNEALGEEDIYKLKSRLSKWYEVGFNLAELFTILQKFNIIVPSKEQFAFSLEFNDTFNTKAKECQSLQTQITSLDKEIDQMVYKLYGLSEEEIEVVEGVV